MRDYAWESTELGVPCAEVTFADLVKGAKDIMKLDEYLPQFLEGWKEEEFINSTVGTAIVETIILGAYITLRKANKMSVPEDFQ